MVIMIIDPDTKQLTHTKAYLEKNNVKAVAFRDPMEAVQYGYCLLYTSNSQKA